MSTALAKTEQQMAEGQSVYRPQMTAEQVDLIKATICKGATDDELRLFIQQCTRTGLDPFSRQIHAVKRWDRDANREVMAIQVGIDGFRLIADRSGRYEGQTEPRWCGKDGAWVDVWLQDGPPAAAKVGVFKAGCREPFWGIARWASYVQTKKDGNPTSFWQKMGPDMLAKCAEALAFRKGFPQELSGLYTREEMQQADNNQESHEELIQRRIAETKEKVSKPYTPPTPAAPPVEDDGLAAILDQMQAATFDQTVALFAAAKAKIVELTDSDISYYEILGKHGMKHGNDLKGKTRKQCKDAITDLFRFCQKVGAEPPITDDDLPPILQGGANA